MDFIAKKKMEVLPINVCYSAKVPKREFEGLFAFCSKNRVKEATLLSLGKNFEEEKEGVKIRVTNMEDWFGKYL